MYDLFLWIAVGCDIVCEWLAIRYLNSKRRKRITFMQSKGVDSDSTIAKVQESMDQEDHERWFPDVGRTALFTQCIVAPLAIAAYVGIALSILHWRIDDSPDPESKFAGRLFLPQM